MSRHICAIPVALIALVACAPTPIDDVDAGARNDAGVDQVQDAGANEDAGRQDAGTQDAGTQDAGTQDAGTQDAGTQDAGTQDAGVDAGPPPDADNDGIPDDIDPDDDNDGATDIEEENCSTDPFDAADVPLDSDGDDVCNVLDLCPLRADDDCQTVSDYRDCYAIKLDGRLGQVATGAYFIDPDEDGPSPPFEAWCEMDTLGGGFTLSIHQTDEGPWASWDHDMDPNANTGTYVADPLHDEDFYRGFGDLITDFTSAQYLFATGDGTHFLLTSSLGLRHTDTGRTGEYDDVAQFVFEDSVGFVRHTYNWSFRDSVLEDPLISVEDVGDAAALTLYAEAGATTLADQAKNQFGGANMFVRRGPVVGQDADGDGFPNEDEMACGTNALDIADVPDDEDGDFVCDQADAFLGNPNEGYDLDGDGEGDNADADIDGDGDDNDVDPYPHRANLTRNLSGLNMSGWDLRAVNLTFSNLTNNDLRDADVRSIDLSAATLTGTDWSGAAVHDLAPRCQDTGYRGGCDLTFLTLGDVDLRGATLINANLTGSNLWFTRFAPTDITGSLWSGVAYAPQNPAARCAPDGDDSGGCNLEGVALQGQDLSGANLIGAHLEGANMEGAIVTDSFWMGARFFFRDALRCQDTDFRGGCDLSGLNLRGMDLSGANLPGATFRLTDADGADLSSANLQGADLFGDFEGASFDEAKLQGANGVGGWFRSASFLRATLDGANFSFAALRFAAWNAQTSLQNANFRSTCLFTITTPLLDGFEPIAGSDLSGAQGFFTENVQCSEGSIGFCLNPTSNSPCSKCSPLTNQTCASNICDDNGACVP